MLVSVIVGTELLQCLNQLVIEVERKEDKEIEHLFEYGKPVCFFTQDMSGKLTYLNFVATVNYVEEDRMVVILPDANALLTLQSKEVVGVQLYFDETSYRLMFEALKQVISAKNNRLAELRDIFHGTQPVSTFSFQPVRFPWLNATQDEAVNKVLHAKDVAIVHGLREQVRLLRWWRLFMKHFIVKIRYWYVHRVTWPLTGLVKSW